MNRAQTLDTAKAYVSTDRQADHGRPEDTFARIARLWNAYLGLKIESYDAAAMMVLLKIARIRHAPGNDDNWCDLAGYAACGAELATESSLQSYEGDDRDA